MTATDNGRVAERERTVSNGLSRAIEVPWGCMAVVPTHHLSAAFGFRLAMLSTLAESIAGMLVSA